MSVINNVLRDLQQQRPALRAVDPDELLDAQKMPVNAGRSGRFVLLLLLAALLVTGVTLWWQPWHPGQGADNLIPAATAIPEAGSTKGKIDRSQAVQTKAAEITEPPKTVNDQPILRGLQIRENESTLVLGFQLSAPVVSYLRQQSGNRYRFVLKQTQSRIEAPRLERNPWVQKLEIEAADADVLIHLQTAPDVRVETSMLDGKAGLPRWELSLHRSPVRETVATPYEPARDKSGSAESTVVAETQTEVPEPKTLAAPTVPAAVQPARAQEAKPSRLDIRSHVPKPEVDSARQQRRQAHELFRAGRYEEMIRRFGKDSAQDDLLALAYQRLGQYQASASAWRRQLQKNPANGRAWVGLALALEGLQQYPEARAAYRRALATGRLSARLEAFATRRLQQPGSTKPATTDRGDK